MRKNYLIRPNWCTILKRFQLQFELIYKIEFADLRANPLSYIKKYDDMFKEPLKRMWAAF